MPRKISKELKGKIAPDSPCFGVIQDAYSVFDYDRPGATGVCVQCCMDPQIERDFLKPDISEMPLHYVRDWFSAASDPGLSKRIWGYLLPRILELLAGDQDPASVGLEVTLSRFPTGDQLQWSAPEWDVLDRFQRLFLVQSMKNRRDYLDDVLCMFGNAGWPLGDLFAQVAAMPDEVIADRLWSDWCTGRPDVWITTFWEGGRNTVAFDFYTSSTMRERMERVALAEATDPELAEKAMAVASVIYAAESGARER